MDKYTKLKQIGKGNFGRVNLVERKSDNKTFAMKLIDLCTENSAKNPNVEANLLKSLEHPNIVKCYETFTEEEHLGMVMEYCEEGDLLQKVKEYKKKKILLPEAEILEWFTQLCLAIKYLHDQKILHRDIKAQNTFLTSSGIIKLGDFGISKQLDQTDEMAMTQTGTPYYLTPEMIMRSSSSLKSDIWMLGCLLHELCSLDKPFQGDNIPSVLNKILKEKYSDIPQEYSPFLHQLVELLLEKDESMRPSIQQIIEMPEIAEQIEKLCKKYSAIRQWHNKSNNSPNTLIQYRKLTVPTLHHFPQFNKFSDDGIRNSSKEREETKNHTESQSLNDLDSYPFSRKVTEEPCKTPTITLVSPKEGNTKPPIDQNSKRKPNNINRIVADKKANLSPSSQFDLLSSFSNPSSTPLSAKQLTSPFEQSKVNSQQQSPLIRPVRVITVYDDLDSSGGEPLSKKLPKRPELGFGSKPMSHKTHLSIDILGPNSETSEHPNSKGEATSKASSHKSPIESTDPNSVPTTKTVTQKKFAFSDQVFDHRSPASPNRSFWVSQFVKEKLGEEKYQKVKDLLESSANPMQVLNDQVLKIVGEENRDCLVMLSFLISHSSSSVTPTGDTTKDSNKIFKNFDKNFKSPLSSQRITKHTFPVNELIDSGQKSTPMNLRSGAKTPKTVLENSKSES